jgi:hypothetical protein
LALTYVTITGSFDDGSGTPLAGQVIFTPSETVYASGIPLVSADNPVTVQIISGTLGTVHLLATDNAGLAYEGLTGFFYWTVQVTAGGITQPGWSFFLPSSPSTADLYSLANTVASGTGIIPPAGDIGGTTTDPTVISAHLAIPLGITQGGTGNAVNNTGDDVQRVGGPWYIYPTYATPGGAWQVAQAAAPYVSLLVANPASGPGNSQNPDYVTQIADATAAGVQVLGYVPTGAAATPIGTVKGMVDSWYSFYPAISGIFFDQVTTDAGAHQAYYQALYAYVKAKDTGQGTVCINPGDIPDVSYMTACDIANVFEDTYAAYQSYVPASWMISYPASRFMNIIHDVDTMAALKATLALTLANRAGYIFVTDNVLYNNVPGTNEGLATYWAYETTWCRQGTQPVPQGAQVVSVTDTAYGAAGNGTTDDTAAFTAAAAAAGPGGILLIPKPPVQYLVSGNIPLPGQLTVIGPGWDTRTPTVKLANSSGAHSVFASAGYLGTAATSDYPVTIRDLAIDVNGANNASAHGIILMTFRGWLDHVYVLNPGLAGLVYSDQNVAGSAVSNTAVENRVTACTVNYATPATITGQYGIWVRDTANSGAMTDGYCTDNVVSGAGDFAIRNERAAGWFITGNHVYNTQQSGMYLGNVWCTFFHHNEVDHFAAAGSAATTYYGYDFETILTNNQPGTNGRPSFIDHNFAGAKEGQGTASTTYHYYRLKNATSSGVSVTGFDHNVAHTDTTGTGTSLAWDFQPNGAAMTLQGGFNVADGPASTLPSFSGTLNQAAPSRVMYQHGSAVTLGLSGSYGTAVTFPAEQASLGYIPTTVAMNWTGTFNSGSGENATAKVVATYNDTTTQTLTFGSVSSVQAQSANDSQRYGLYKDGLYLTQLAVSAQSSLGSTAVILTAEIAGFNAN